MKPAPHSGAYANLEPVDLISGTNRSSNWTKVVGPITTADGSVVADPYSISNFISTLGKEPRTPLGRVLMCGSGGTSVAFQVCSATAGATVQFQLFGFAPFKFNATDNINRSTLAVPCNDQALWPNDQYDTFALGSGYNLAPDAIGGDVLSAVCSTTSSYRHAFRNVLGATTADGHDPYFLSTATPYFYSPTLLFELRGNIGFMPWVTSMGGSTSVYILGRSF